MENNHEDHAFKFTEDSVFIITYSMGKLDNSMLNYEIQYVIFWLSLNMKIQMYY